MARGRSGVVSHVVVLLCGATLVAGAGGGAPSFAYPTSACDPTTLPSLVMYVIDTSRAPNQPDDLMTVSSIQGVTARACPQVYTLNGNQASYLQFLNATLDANNATLTANTTYMAGDVAGLLKQFAPAFTDGYILAVAGDPNATPAAWTAAAATSAVVVTPANEAYAVAAGLPLLLDVRNMTVSQVLDRFNVSAASFSRTLAVLQDPTKVCCLGDYSIFARAITWWDTDMASALTSRVLSSLQGPAAVLGWGTDESTTVIAASVYGGFVHASDWARDLSVLTSFRAQDNMTAHVPPSAVGSVVEVMPLAPPAPVHTVTFLMTDGDNIQWMLNDFTTNPAWWASPDRGYVPLGWTLSPAIIDLAPIVASILHSTASANDCFVSAPSGVGYTYPDVMPPAVLTDFVDVTGSYMARSGMTIVNALAQTYTTPAAAAYLADDRIDALVWYDYYSYSALGGNLTFVNGKPVVGGRFQLWTGTFDDPSTLLAKLLAQPADPTSAAGYSLIPVHVWTDNVTEVRWVAEQLAAHGGFEVVTPTTFIQRIMAYVPH